MQKFALSLWFDDAGAVLSAELVMILTLCVLAMVVGLSEVASAVNCELLDVAYAIRGFNQSYAFPGFRGCWPKGGFFAGSRFYDQQQGICTGFCGNGVAVGGYGTGMAVGGYGGYGGDVISGTIAPSSTGAAIQGAVIPCPPAQSSVEPCPPGTTYVPGTTYTPGSAWQPVPGSTPVVPGAVDCPTCPSPTTPQPVLTAPVAPATPSAADPVPAKPEGTVK